MDSLYYNVAIKLHFIINSLLTVAVKCIIFNLVGDIVPRYTN